MINQTTRLIRLNCPLTAGSFAVSQFEGTEAVSHSFKYTLTLYSNTVIQPSELIRHSATVELGLGQMQTRFFNGLIQSIACGSLDTANMYEHTLTLSSWFDTLKLSGGCRVFQHKNIIDIVTQLFKEKGHSNYDLSALSRQYPKLNYCVQYNESDYDFINRLLEQAGIYTYFQHTDHSHILRLMDVGSLPESLWPRCPYNHHDSSTPHITQLNIDGGPISNTFQVGGFNIDLKKHRIQGEVTTQPQTDPEGFNHFSFYHFTETIHANHHATEKARRDQARDWINTHTVQGESGLTQLTPGYIMPVDAPTDTRYEHEYLLLSVTHSAHDFTQLPHMSTLDSPHIATAYTNQFTCMNAQHDFYPACHTPCPSIRGIQPALVVGPQSGQAIYTDTYGRVKVQFYWDELGQLNENSSCFLPVAALSGGHLIGSQQIPHVGDEVSVLFCQGNINFPVVIASAYNPMNSEPFTLPKQAHINGITTHTQNSKDLTQGHQIIFDDTPAQECLQIHSENQLNTSTINNVTHTAQGGEICVVNKAIQHSTLNGKLSLWAHDATFYAAGSTLTFHQGQIAASGKTICFKVKDAPTQPIARVGDNHTCPKVTDRISHVGGPILTGSGTMRANNKPVARVQDKAKCHIGQDIIAKGVSNFLVNGRPAAIKTSQCAHGQMVVAGSPNVFVGAAVPKP